MTVRAAAAAVGCLAVAAPAPAVSPADCLASAKPEARWNLPVAYREVSGLALAPDGRLFYHNDEHGLIGALDSKTGKILGSYQVGTPAVRGDFEGIAIRGQRILLVTSGGVLYDAPLPPATTDRGVLAATRRVTGLGTRCEIEGLAVEPASQDLLFACKTPRVAALAKQVTVFRLPGRDSAVPTAVALSREALAKGRPGRGFHPSAIEVDPRTGHWVILASADQAVAVVTAAGEVLATAELRGRHGQPEGLAMAPDGRIFVSDEGGRSRGTVTVYDCR
ncbi:MAG: SdiA-regulated domain-containing protein [Gemmatimonadales bacterium]